MRPMQIQKSAAVFISHSWSYSEHYDKLAEWLFDLVWSGRGYDVKYHNTSIPATDPIHYAQNVQQLRAAIYDRIAISNVVVIPTGMYVNYSKWIQEEIGGANSFGVPILAVDPWGQERKSSVVSNAASEIVGWNSDSVANGVWRLTQY